MDLFIQIKDGQPFEHPIFDDNFRAAFPHLNVDDLPEGFARFVRVPQNVTPGIYEVAEVSYQWVGNVVMDVWCVRPMSAQEHAETVRSQTRTAYELRDALRALAAQHLAALDNDNARSVWAAYRDLVDTWTLTDPAAPNPPIPPRQNELGLWISTSSPGRPPDVAG